MNLELYCDVANPIYKVGKVGVTLLREALQAGGPNIILRGSPIWIIPPQR